MWNSKLNQEVNLEPEILAGSETFAKHATTVASLEKYSSTGLEGIFGVNFAKINCYPNPFNEQVTIEIILSNDAEVSVEILNILGQKITSLATKQKIPAGIKQYTWNGRNPENSKVVSGICYIQVNINGSNFVKKVVLNR